MNGLMCLVISLFGRVLCVKTGFGILLLVRKVSRQLAHLTDAQPFCFLVILWCFLFAVLDVLYLI